MKSIYIITYFIIMTTHFFTYPMNHNQANAMLGSNRHVKKLVKRVQIASSIGTIIGGWGFFIVNSQMFTNQLSYRVKRAPLALFLTCCTINQTLLLTKIESYSNTVESVEEFIKK